MEQILIYTECTTSRLLYTLDVILVQLMDLQYELTSNSEYFQNSKLPKINYSAHRYSNSINISPAGLLFQAEIAPIEPAFGKWKNIPVLFCTKEDSEFPFDIFSASFYMLTRYEEYFSLNTDKNKRFFSENSIAFKNGFLEEPIIQQWCSLLAEALKTSFSIESNPLAKFQLESTIDIDNAFAFLGKSKCKISVSVVKDFLLLKWKSVYDRLMVIFLLKQDPFDTYGYIVDLHKHYGLRPDFFYLTGKYGLNSKTIPLKITPVQNILCYLEQHGQIGIQLSYESLGNFLTLDEELDELNHILSSRVITSRQNGFCLSFPKTYQRLVKAGIQHDYSMGYHDRPGFRAGIAAPYPFYDLETEKVTQLVIHPFILTDRVLKDKIKLSPDEALMKIQELIRKVVVVNGTFGIIWHNDSVSDYGEWRGWCNVYNIMHSIASQTTNKSTRS